MSEVLLITRQRLHPVELMLKHLPEDTPKAYLRAQCYYEWGRGYQPKSIDRTGKITWHYRPGITIEDHYDTFYEVGRDGAIRRLTPKLNKWERRRLQER